MAITMTITGETPLEIFATIKGCAALLAPGVPEAKLEEIPAQAKAPAPTPGPSAQTAPSAYIPVAKAAPNQQQAAVPTAQAPAYTLEQIAKAGADLVAAKPELMPTLMQLLQQYGAKMVTELKPEQLGPFATELRQLGAKI